MVFSPVNTINLSMQDEFSSVLDQIESNDDIKACVLISKKEGCFVAGADIQMINKVTSVEEGAAMSRGGQEMFGRIERSHKPFLAAINGPALGGKHHKIFSKSNQDIKVVLNWLWLAITELPQLPKRQNWVFQKLCWVFFPVLVVPKD